MWLAVAFAARSDAASLFKCRDAEGRVSYQSAPCDPGSVQVWERPVEPVQAPLPSPAPTQAATTGSGRDPRLNPAGRRPGPTTRPALPARKSASAACRRAHAADAAYRAQPLSRVKHDGLRRHGDRIRAACG
jgi:hypothetical protein